MKDVKIYTTDTCPYCSEAKDYFNKKKIKFKEINLSKDDKKVGEMIKISGQSGVPVIVIGKRVIIGFDKPAIEEALN